MRNQTAKVPMLAAPGIGLIINSQCADMKTARWLLTDRIANGCAYPDEHIVRVPLSAYVAHRTTLHSVSAA